MFSNIAHFEGVDYPLIDAIIFLARVCAVSAHKYGEHNVLTINNNRWRGGKHYKVTVAFDHDKRLIVFVPKKYYQTAMPTNRSAFLWKSSKWNTMWTPDGRHDHMRSYLRDNLPKLKTLTQPNNVILFHDYVRRIYWNLLSKHHASPPPRRAPSPPPRRAPSPPPRRAPSPCSPILQACRDRELTDPKKCFRSLMMKGEWRHPDRGGDKQKFQLLNQCLGDEKEIVFDDTWQK